MNDPELAKAEAVLMLLRKCGVKSAELVNREIHKVELFPSVDGDLEKRSRADEDDDAKVNPSTGLTKARTRDLLVMDE